MNPNIEKILNTIASTEYESTDSTIPGAIHTYGQIPGLNAFLLSSLLSIRKDTLDEAVEVLPEEKEIRHEGYEYGDTSYDSDAVICGRNEAISEMRDNLLKLRG